MKKIILTLFVILASVSFSNASHISGGDIQYEYIGDSTGISHHYRIFLRLYRRVGGAGLPTTTTVQVKSSCYSQISVSMPLVPFSGQIDSTLFDCVDAPTLVLEQYVYIGYVTLSGVCSDWVFSWNSCCRPPGITNLVNSQSAFYFEAKLNNFLGDNTSPFFVSAPATAFCTNQSYNFKQSVIEPDGDSIHYSIIACRGNNATNDLPLNAGWTHQQPITTSPPQSLTMDAKTGIISFTPSAIEVDVLALLVDEYRWDTVYGLWVHIGSSNRDMMVQILATCSQAAQAGVKLDFNQPGVYLDPVNGLPTVDYPCLDSTIVLYFSNKLDCSTISPDGTDFRLTAPTGQPIPIKEIVSICDYNNETKQLLIKLHKPLSVNGKYWMYSKIGNDGNTLVNKCGFGMSELDTIQLNVQGCFQLQMDLKNVTIQNDLNPRIEWEADTASYPVYLFDKMKVFRKGPIGPYQHVGDVFDPLKTFYDDPQIDWIGVDQDSYSYKIEMVLNNLDMGKTRDIHSILLEGGGTTCDTVPLAWNSYNGWNNPSYEVEIGTPDGSGGYTWAVHSNALSPSNPTTDTTYLMVNSMNVGNYKIRINTVDPSATYTAYSNWINCNVPVPPIPIPDTVWVPNVFSPNNDGYNDLFTIENVEQFKTRRSVYIQNRWGKIVYKHDMYENTAGIVFDGTDSSGNKLADGVYFYVVDLYDEASGKSYEDHGSVHIVTGE